MSLAFLKVDVRQLLDTRSPLFTETVADGEPVDIPADSFVSVRVEMPANSIWNQKQRNLQEAMDKVECESEQNQQGTQS